MAKPVGGLKKLKEKIKYPEFASDAHIEGRVLIRVFIDEKGKVVKTEIVKGLGYGCDKAVKKVVESTKFSPGKNMGIPVKTQILLPIDFRLIH